MNNDMKLLFISGNWDNDKGRSSKYMEKINKAISNKLDFPVNFHNGGNIDDLKKIVVTAKNYDVVLWFPNIPKDLIDKNLINPKNFNNNIILVNEKRNDYNKYSFNSIISIAISNRASLSVELRKNSRGVYETRLIDVQGVLWCDWTDNINKLVSSLLSRCDSLRKLTYTKLFKLSFNMLNTKLHINHRLIDLYEYFGDYLKEHSSLTKVARHLGEITMKDFNNPDIYYSSIRNMRFLDQDKPLVEDDFVPVKLLSNKINYYDNDKPHRDIAVTVKLLQELPDTKYILMSDFYHPEARFTDIALPTGCDKIYYTVKRIIDKDNLSGNFVINLLGKGSMIFGNDIETTKKYINELKERKLPEELGVGFNRIEIDDGKASFIATLDNRPLMPNEEIEIRFNDGSVGCYPTLIKYYKDDKDRTHKDAYIKLIIKGLPIDFPITGLYARRI